MESLHKLFAPHSAIISKIAGALTFLQVFSVVFLLNDIRKVGSTNGFPVLPFIGGFVLSVMFLQFGLIIDDQATIEVNLFCLILNILYLCVYFFYTPSTNKWQFWKNIGLGTIFSIVCEIYVRCEDQKLVEFRYGTFITVILILYVAAPLFDLKTIIRTKNSASLPFPLIASGTVVTITWLFYGFAINNSVMVAQNVLLLALSVFQLILCMLYPSKIPEVTDSKKKPE